MNARSTSFEFTCLGKRINEIVSAIFHSVIFNRCYGKFHYKQEHFYSIGTLGFEEVICDFIDFTYIRVASLELAKHVNQYIKTFVEELSLLASNNIRKNAAARLLSYNKHQTMPSSFRKPSSALLNMEPPIEQRHYSGSHKDFVLFPQSPLIAATAATGSISLEFLLKNKSRPFTFSDSLIWEVWTLKINCLKDEANEPFFNKTTIEDQLFDKILSIVSIVNQSNSYLPQMPSESELDNVFDTSFPDVQPFNFKISYKIDGKESNESRTSGSSDIKSGLGQMLSAPSQERLKKFFEKLSL